MNLKRMKQAGWLLVALAVICSFTLWGQRLQSEADYKQVQMVVNYNDILALANGNQMSQEELAAQLQARGVSAVLFKEWTLGDLANNGQVALQLGATIKNTNFIVKCRRSCLLTKPRCMWPFWILPSPSRWKSIPC